MASLRQKVEAAFKAVLENAGAQPVYTGFAATDKEGSCVICKAKSAAEEPLQSGNYNVTVQIFVKGPPDEDGAFDDLATLVRDALWTDGLPAALQTAAAGGLTVYGVASNHELEWTEEGDTWIETQTIIIHCNQIAPA